MPTKPKPPTPSPSSSSPSKEPGNLPPTTPSSSLGEGSDPVVVSMPTDASSVGITMPTASAPPIERPDDDDEDDDASPEPALTATETPATVRGFVRVTPDKVAGVLATQGALLSLSPLGRHPGQWIWTEDELKLVAPPIAAQLEQAARKSAAVRKLVEGTDLIAAGGGILAYIIRNLTEYPEEPDAEGSRREDARAVDAGSGSGGTGAREVAPVHVAGPSSGLPDLADLG